MEEMIHGPQMAFDEDTYVFLVASEEKRIGAGTTVHSNSLRRINTEHVL